MIFRLENFNFEEPENVYKKYYKFVTVITYHKDFVRSDLFTKYMKINIEHLQKKHNAITEHTISLHGELFTNEKDVSNYTKDLLKIFLFYKDLKVSNEEYIKIKERIINEY